MSRHSSRRELVLAYQIDQRLAVGTVTATGRSTGVTYSFGPLDLVNSSAALLYCHVQASPIEQQSRAATSLSI